MDPDFLVHTEPGRLGLKSFLIGNLRSSPGLSHQDQPIPTAASGGGEGVSTEGRCLRADVLFGGRKLPRPVDEQGKPSTSGGILRRSFWCPESVFVGFSCFPASLRCFSLYVPVSLDTGEAAGEFRFSAAPGPPRQPRAGSREPRAHLLLVVLPGPRAGTESRIPCSSERWRRRRLQTVPAEGARGGGKLELCALVRVSGEGVGRTRAGQARSRDFEPLEHPSLRAAKAPVLRSPFPPSSSSW